MNKNNFNLDIFFKELSNNLLNFNTNPKVSGANTDLDLIVEKANENKDIVWDGGKKLGDLYGYKEDNIIDFNPNYCLSELIFPLLDKSLKYEPIFEVSSGDQDDGPNNLACKYGYISSSKKEESFIFYSNGYGPNVDGCPIKMFSHKVKKEELNNFPNLILDHYKTTFTSKTIGPADVYIYGDYQWDLNFLTKVLDKSLQARKAHAKELEGFDYDHTMRIWKKENNKDFLGVKILK